MSAPSVRRRTPGEWCTIIVSAAARSAVPAALVKVAATMRPLRFSISAWPMKLSLATRPLQVTEITVQRLLSYLP